MINLEKIIKKYGTHVITEEWFGTMEEYRYNKNESNKIYKIGNNVLMSKMNNDITINDDINFQISKKIGFDEEKCYLYK